MKITPRKILETKNKEKLICLTSYTYPMTKVLDEFCDLILVGDSLGMTIYGFEDTVDVTLDMMINHGKAVSKAAKKSLVIVDLPFGTYEKSKEQALEAAKRVVRETNCDAIKIEVTTELLETAKYLVDNGINFVGHVGLLPQHVRKIGGYKYQGKDKNSADEILETSRKIAEIGAFALVIEAVPANLAQKITEEISIPTIGIGASNKCDGQVLVIDDLLGLNQEFKPKFVTRYANLVEEISEAVAGFVKDVKEEKFPAKDNML